MLDQFYTVPEVAHALKISRGKMYRLVQQGLMPHIRIGRNVRIRESDLQKWIDVNCVTLVLPDGQYVFLNLHS
jgi:excisionase family DNA binding protein